MIVAARHRRQQPLDRLAHALEVGGVGAEQDALRQLVVLGLAEQVHRDPVGRRRAVGEHEDLARAGDHVDADRAEDAPLGARHVGVAGAGDLVHRGDRRRAVGQRADRLRAADREDAIDAGDRRRREHERVALAAPASARPSRSRRRRRPWPASRSSARSTDRPPCRPARRCRRGRAASPSGRAACRRRRGSSSAAAGLELALVVVAHARGGASSASALRRRDRASAARSSPARSRARRPTPRRCRRSGACTRAPPRRRARARRPGSRRRGPRSRRRPRPSRRAAPSARRRSRRRCCRGGAGATLMRRARRRPAPPRASASIERADRLALELQRRLVDDQAGRDLHDLLDLDEVVGLQRVARGDEVDDRIGQAGQRRQLHRAVELDQVDVHALVGEVVARDAREFGGDADARALARRARRSRSRPAPRRSCGSARRRGRAAGTGPRRRARSGCPGRPRRGRRRRAARRSARRWRGPAPGARRRAWCARISLRLFSGSSATSMPAAASSGKVSSKMRPFDSASVITIALPIVERDQTHARCRRRARAAWPPCGRSRGRGGRCGRPRSRPRRPAPAMTRQAEARRSVAITVAPDSLDAVDHRVAAVDLDLARQAGPARPRA